MAEESPHDRLLEWSLGSFHTCFFVLTLVILLYTRGVLGELLGSLNTLIGFALFAALWCTTLWCTRRALRAIALRQGRTAPILSDPLDLWTASILWGGVNGALFFLILILFILIPSLASPASLLGLPVYLLIGVSLAAVVGGAAGLSLALLDSLLLAFARALLPSKARRK